MLIHKDLDCIIVGYNDMDFEQFSAKQKATRDHWGAYHEVQMNSVIYDDSRITFVELMNRAIEGASGSDPRLNVFEAPSLAVCYLSSYLQKRGFSVEEVNFFTYQKERLAELLARSPRAVAITTTFYVMPEPVKEVVRFVREHNPEVTIIVGGPHIYNTCSDYREDPVALDFLLQSIGADIYINDSQGERALSQVLAELRRGAGAELDKVHNLAFTSAEGFKRTAREVEQNDIDAEAVDWSLFSSDFIAPIALMRTARSCPFSCSFCQYPLLAGAHVVNTVDNVEQQLRTLHEAGTRVAVFVDDTFNVPLPRFKKMLQMMIDNKFDFRWVSFLRCSNVDEQALDLMAESGCAGALLGIESGDQQMLVNMNKKVKIDRYHWGIRALEQRGIAAYASIICGFPGETPETVIRTSEFLEETSPSFLNIQLYYHDKSAPIHRRAKEFGITGSGYNWRHNTMDWKEAMSWAKYLLRNTHNTTYISTYNLSLWGIAYLLAKGISMEQVKAFGKATRDMLFDSLEDHEVNIPERMKVVIDVFRPGAGAAGKGLCQAVDEVFWRGKLADPPVPVPLTEEPALGRLGVESVALTLDEEVSRGLQEMAQNARITISNLMLALFKLYLYQWTKHERIYVGVQTTRTTVPVWTRLSDGMEFEEVVDEVVRNADQALDHQDHDFSALPAPNVLFAYRNILGEVAAPRGDFDLRLVLERREGALGLTLEYESGLFSSRQANEVLRNLERFSQMVVSPMAA